MPGALNLPYTELIRDGRLKDVQTLYSLFTSHGLDLTRPIVTSCGSGITASVLALGLEQCGVERISLYDGSWAEYAQHPEAIIATE